MPPEVATPTTIKHFPEKLPQGPSNRNQNVTKEKMTFIRPHPNCNAVFFRSRGKFDDKLGACLLLGIIERPEAAHNFNAVLGRHFTFSALFGHLG
jgi:hypothetical protein